MNIDIKNSENKDNIQFRILYFIGIFLIVANHCDGGSLSLLYEWFPAYSFHLALFIFASGYFFINNKDKNIWQFIKKIIKKFLIPLYFWNIIYGLLVQLLQIYGFKFGQDLSFNSLLILPIYDGHQFILNLATWFIWPLFLIQFFNIFIIKILKKYDYFFIVYFVITLLLGFLGIQFAIEGHNTGFYLLLDKILYFLPFFSFGMLYRVTIEKFDNINNYLYFSIIFLISLIIIYHFGGTIKYYPSWCNNFDNFYRPFAVGFLGIAFWLRVSKILVPSLKDSKLIKIISKNTFPIMIHHITGIFLLNLLWYILAIKFNFIAGFDVNQFKTNIWYFYCPKELINFKIIYLIFSFSFPLIIVYITNYLKKLKDKVF